MRPQGILSFTGEGMSTLYKNEHVMNTSLRQTDTYKEVMTWLRDRDTTPDEEIEGRFIDIVAQLVAERLQRSEQRHRRRRPELPPAPLSIRSIMHEITGAYEPDGVAAENAMTHGDLPAEQKPGEAAPHKGLGSLMLAKALRHMAIQEEMQLTMAQIQAILYIAYGVWLAKHGDRLFDEHPQMWKYGPVFPRVYAKLRKDVSDGCSEYNSLKNLYPDRFRFLSNCFRRFAWTKACILTSPHVSDGSPWSDTRRSNPDRWAVRIEDELIRKWFLPKV